MNVVAAFIVAFVLYLLWQRLTSSKSSSTSSSKKHTSSWISSALSAQASASSTFKTIGDRFRTFEELQAGLRHAGLESSNLIVGVDFTSSNTWTGQRTFGGRNLHALEPTMLNPYQSVISIMGRTLEVFDDDKLIPAYGFGDKTTADRSVFNLNPNGASCQGFEEVLKRYNETVPRITLAGPTSFAPIIREAIRIVKEAKAYHILVIVADGQVTNTQETVNAIVEASNYPLSILLVGVGDGPWDQMNEFDDNLPQRRFDNFQFVDFHTTMVRNDGSEVVFATQAMMEIPDQFKAIRDLNLFQNCK
jgi:hypothetical protein